MLKGEDIQLLQDSHTGVDTRSVLVATHTHQSGHCKLPVEATSVPGSSMTSSSLNPIGGQLGFSSQFVPPLQYGLQHRGSVNGPGQSTVVLFSYGPSSQYSQSTTTYLPAQNVSQ